MLAPSDDRPLNVMVYVDQLPDFSLPFRGQCRHENPPLCVANHDTSASAVPAPEPYDTENVTLRQLIDEVRTLSV